MLRSLVSGARGAYTCLAVPSKQMVASPASRKMIHSSLGLGILDRDHPQKRLSKNKAVEEDELFLGEDESSEVSTEEEFMPVRLFPTLETHSMIFDGVRFDELPIVHVKSSMNNTIVNVTKHTGESIGIASGGSVGFRNVKKGTTIAAQAAATDVGQRVFDKGIKTVRVCLKGIGPGRLPALKGLQLIGLNIVSITDTTPLPHNGNRPRKPRRI